MISVGTCSRVALPRVSGAMKMRLGQVSAPIEIGSSKEGMEFLNDWVGWLTGGTGAP